MDESVTHRGIIVKSFWERQYVRLRGIAVKLGLLKKDRQIPDVKEVLPFTQDGLLNEAYLEAEYEVVYLTGKGNTVPFLYPQRFNRIKSNDNS